MCQAGLSAVNPTAIKTVTVADQDAAPVLDEFLESTFGAIGVDAVERHPVVNHGPEPVEIIFVKPGRFIDVVAVRAAGHISNFLIGRCNRLSRPVDDLLNSAGGNRDAQHGFTKAFDILTTHGLDPTEFGDEGAHSGAIAGGGHLR